jgi:hypothetical protein
MKAMVLATLSTGNFDFIAMGVNTTHAECVMRAAWIKHKQQTHATLTWSEVAEDVNYTLLAPGEAVRDYDTLVTGIDVR